MTARAILRWAARILVGALVFVLLGVALAYGVSERRGHRRYDVPEHPIRVASDSATIALGEHLATIRGCNDCHAPDMAGKVMVDDKAFGRLVAGNLTPGRRGGVLSDRDWERAVRHGLRPDSTPLNYMPSQDLAGISDEDLAAIVAWARSLPAVVDSLPPTRMGPLARVLHVTGELVLFSAEKVDHAADHPSRVMPAADAAYGQYLGAGCQGCHGATFSGGKIPGGPPDWPPAADITPTGMRAYTEASFLSAMRTGKRPDGTDIRMPMDVRITGAMSEVELKALWAFLQTLPPTDGVAR